MMVSIISNGRAVGFLLERRHEWEAFCENQKSLGVFDEQAKAIRAVYDEHASAGRGVTGIMRLGSHAGRD